MNDFPDINSQNLTIEKVKKYICPMAEDKEILFFANICKKFDLNPLPVFREVYLVKYGNNPATILTGYETYLKRADRTEKYGGMKAWTEGTIDAKTLKGCVEVYRKDWERPLYHEVLYEEYVQYGKTKEGEKYVNKFWKEKPHTMIKKVAISQAFRLAFPDEFSGLPYTREEYNEVESTEMPKIPVSMPKSKAEVANAEKSQPEANSAEVIGISEAEGKALLEYAQKNGWTKDDLKEYAKTLGYERLSAMNAWDYEDVLEYFKNNKKSDVAKIKKDLDAQAK